MQLKTNDVTLNIIPSHRLQLALDSLFEEINTRLENSEEGYVIYKSFIHDVAFYENEEDEFVHTLGLYQHGLPEIYLNEKTLTKEEWLEVNRIIETYKGLKVDETNSEIRDELFSRSIRRTLKVETDRIASEEYLYGMGFETRAYLELYDPECLNEFKVIKIRDST